MRARHTLKCRRRLRAARVGVDWYHRRMRSSVWFRGALGVLMIGVVQASALVVAQTDALAIHPVPVAASRASSLVRLGDGTVLAWGVNEFVQLGDGSTASRLEPDVVQRLPLVQAVAATDTRGFAVDADGHVWHWGGEGVRLNATNAMLAPVEPLRVRVEPARVNGLDRVVGVAAGPLFAFALREDGSVWAFDDPAARRLRARSTMVALMLSQSVVVAHEAYEVPQRVNGVGNVRALAVAYDRVALVRDDGTVWVWGPESWVHWVDPERMGLWVDPLQVPSLSDVHAVAAGADFFLALRTDGTVWAWGMNESGQLGDGTEQSRQEPVQVLGLSDVEMIAAGFDHALAVRDDGSVWAWGANALGQLGDGGEVARSVPGEVIGLTDVVGIAAGWSHSLAITADGGVWSWGWDRFEPYGAGREDWSVPRQVTLP